MTCCVTNKQTNKEHKLTNINEANNRTKGNNQHLNNSSGDMSCVSCFDCLCVGVNGLFVCLMVACWLDRHDGRDRRRGSASDMLFDEHTRRAFIIQQQQRKQPSNKTTTNTLNTKPVTCVVCCALLCWFAFGW